MGQHHVGRPVVVFTGVRHARHQVTHSAAAERGGRRLRWNRTKPAARRGHRMEAGWPMSDPPARTGGGCQGKGSDNEKAGPAPPGKKPGYSPISRPPPAAQRRPRTLRRQAAFAGLERRSPLTRARTATLPIHLTAGETVRRVKDRPSESGKRGQRQEEMPGLVRRRQE